MHKQIPAGIALGTTTFKEDRDCTVKAFAIAMGTTYAIARAHLKAKCGRVDGRGIVSRRVLPDSLKSTPYRIGPYSKSNRISLGRFCKEHPVGRFYVSVRGHAIAVVDGDHYDFIDSPRRMVTWAIRLYPKHLD